MNQPQPLTHIVTLVVETDASTWVEIFPSWAAAQNRLANWCIENWDNELGDVPSDPHEICETYFNRDDGSGLSESAGTADLTIFDLATFAEVEPKDAPPHIMAGAHAPDD